MRQRNFQLMISTIRVESMLSVFYFLFEVVKFVLFPAQTNDIMSNENTIF